MNSASQVFNIPELLELILLSLPHDTTNQEVTSMRTLLLAQTTCRTWHTLLRKSTPIRKALYLSSPVDALEAQTWHAQHSSEPAAPNTWIPHLLLQRRSWSSAYPLNDDFAEYFLHSSAPRLWSFSFEVSKRQFSGMPRTGPWRSMLASSPPFTDFWYTRCFYELGSGRAPFVTHVDYDGTVPKHRQKYSKHRPRGVTLGDLVDAVVELFEGHSQTKFVMIESVRVPRDEIESAWELKDDRPRTKDYVPGMSAELGWHREL